MGQECPAGAVDALNVELEHVIKSGFVDIHGGEWLTSADTIDEDIDWTVIADGGGHRLFHVLGIRYVQMDGAGLASSGLSFAGGEFCSLLSRFGNVHANHKRTLGS